MKKTSLTCRLLRLIVPASLLLSACSSGPNPDWDSISVYLTKQYPNLPSMTTDELALHLADKSKPIVLVDARAEKEYLVSHLADSLLADSRLSLGERLRQQIGDGATPLIVIYCSVGVRSASITKQLSDEGFEQVYNLEGSLFEWANKALPMVNAEGATSKAHPYNEAWGQLLNRQHWSWGEAADD